MSLRLRTITVVSVLTAIALGAIALAHWNLHHKEWVRLVLGGGVVAMGLLILITV